MSAVIAVAGYPALTLLPVFAGSLTAPGIEGYSVLMVCAGAGAIVGTLVAAWLGTVSQMVRTTLGGIGLLGLFIVAFAASRVPWLSYALLFLVGAGLMLASCTLTSLAQSMVPDDMRGRVMGVYLVASRGGAPVGSLVCGYLATLTSASRVLSVGGMILFVTSVASLAWDRQRTPLRG
jgi:predicted MFS family arabinose efflux permease